MELHINVQAMPTVAGRSTPARRREESAGRPRWPSSNAARPRSRADGCRAIKPVGSERWYEQHDRDEDAALTRVPAPPTLVRLRTEVDDAKSQLQVVAQRIQTLTNVSEAARRENTALQRQLAQRATVQPV